MPPVEIGLTDLPKTVGDFFFNWQTEKKSCFVPMRGLFSFSTAQTEKNPRKKLVKTSDEIVACYI